ncbi:MAG: TonB-dependent receptor [Spirosomataceae bacterium]
MRYCLLLFLGCSFGSLFAQTDTAQVRLLAPVTVTSGRLPIRETRLPAALTVIDGFRIQAGQAQLSLHESLGAVAGLWAMNPDNYAQDLRISVRGFGARAAFGIRGIRVLVDGIPESTPDGQADVDNLDPSALRRMEVMRGPASGLYGNAAGGVLSLQTQNAEDIPLAEAQLLQGAYGFKGYKFRSGFQKNKFSSVLTLSRNETDGFRQHSRMENLILNAKVGYAFDSLTRLSLLFNYGYSPQADDPGGLTQAQVNENRQQASANNLKFNTGEAVEQGRLGLVFEKKMGKHQLFTRAFMTKRQLDNLLAFEAAGAGQLNRTFSGGSVQYTFSEPLPNGIYRVKVGFDVENQEDRRQRFDNKITSRGKQTLDQLERFQNVAGFVTQELELREKLTVLAGLRFDAIRMSVTDQFLSDGDQSGEKRFTRFNPTLGASYGVSPALNLYTNLSSSFETPTLSELSNNPSGTGGFNPDLAPQRAVNYEIGLKSNIQNRIRFDLALFQVNVKDELVPFQLQAFPGRVFYRNAGASQRRGIETSLSASLAKGLVFFGNYTYSHFIYQSYQTTAGTFDGNTLPGIPKHLWYDELRYFRPTGFFGIVQLRHAGELFADDANTSVSPGYTLLNLRAGYQLKISKLQVEFFGGANNVFDVIYTNNVQINAAAGRYFEPAMGRNAYVGVRVGVGK